MAELLFLRELRAAAVQKVNLFFFGLGIISDVNTVKKKNCCAD